MFVIKLIIGAQYFASDMSVAFLLFFFTADILLILCVGGSKLPSPTKIRGIELYGNKPLGVNSLRCRHNTLCTSSVFHHIVQKRFSETINR